MRVVVDVAAGPACSIRPWSITTTRSATAMASGWVWVTWTKVMPSSRCMRAKLAAHLQAQELVERRQRLVEQQHARVGDQRAGERDALLLAAGELAPACARRSAAICTRSSISRALAALRLADAAHLQIEGDVVEAGQMREQRVVLEHHGGAALHRRQADHRLAVDPDVAARSASRGRRSCAGSSSCRSRTGRAGSNRCRPEW